MKATGRQFRVGPLAVSVFVTKELLGKEAAALAAVYIQTAIEKRKKAQITFAAANSQMGMIESLVATRGPRKRGAASEPYGSEHSE